MEKISKAQAGEMMKLAAENLRSLSEENQALTSEVSTLREKVAGFEKRERAEKIAKEMDEKGLEPGASYSEKVAGLMGRDNLDVVEEAIRMAAPQIKVAHIHDDSKVPVEGGEGSQAEAQFVASLATL
jgi:regulator of replication initiation timing